MFEGIFLFHGFKHQFHSDITHNTNRVYMRTISRSPKRAHLLAWACIAKGILQTVPSLPYSMVPHLTPENSARCLSFLSGWKKINTTSIKHQSTWKAATGAKINRNKKKRAGKKIQKMVRGNTTSKCSGNITCLPSCWRENTERLNEDKKWVHYQPASNAPQRKGWGKSSQFMSGL